MGKEVVHADTGEIMNIPGEQVNEKGIFYQNVSLLKVTPEEQQQLEKKVEEKQVEIRPDGFLYLPQVFYREILNTVFGIGQWALVMHRDIIKDKKLFYDGSLYIRGCFVSRSMGEAVYHDNNENQSLATVLEAAKSDCLVRCSKDLGIAKELWQPQWNKQWQEKYALKVWREKTGKHKENGNWADGSYQWRKKDAEPFYDERGKSEAKQQNKQKEAGKKESGKAESSPEPTTLEKKVKQLHAVGTQLYGDKWDSKRKELCLSVSKKRTSSSKELNETELDRLIKAIQDEQKKRDQAITDQHKKMADKSGAKGSVDTQKALFEELKRKIGKVDNGIDFTSLLTKEQGAIDLVTDPEMSAELTLVINKRAKELGVNLAA